MIADADIEFAPQLAMVERRPRWWIDAADLLSGPLPGPTPWLVDSLIVDQALAAAVGRWKTLKSWGLLEVCVAIATGRPAFGRFDVPTPGPVVFINEESGADALRRRLDALLRGRATDPEALRGRLLVAANAGVRLDDASWQNDLLDFGHEIKPRLIVFDPLARMKSAGRDENAQAEMAPLLEFLRLLRDQIASAVLFVHHTGHSGGQMRGSSDLESVWESRLAWNRDGQSSVVTVTAVHREAEAPDPFEFHVGWDPVTSSMRLDAVAPEEAPLRGASGGSDFDRSYPT
jgi:RecA-family ATPase